MTRSKCPSCGTPLNDYRLIACPTCHIVFGEYERSQLDFLRRHKDELTSEIVDRLWRRLLTRFVAAFLAILTLAGLGLWQLYKAVTADLPELVSSDINQRFAQPNITKLMEEAAKAQSSTLMESVINPELKNFQSDISTRLHDFESFLERSQDTINSAIQTLNERVEALNPYTKPIMTANCHVVITSLIRAGQSSRRASNVINPSGILTFESLDTPLLVLEAERQIIQALQSEMDSSQKYYNEITHFRTAFSLSSASTFPKVILNDLNQTKSLKINLGRSLNGRKLYNGQGNCSVNSVVNFDFTIEPQIIDKEGYFSTADIGQLLNTLE